MTDVTDIIPDFSPEIYEEPLEDSSLPAGPPKLRGPKKKFAEAWLRTPNMVLAAKAAGAPYQRESEFAQKWFDDRDVQAYLLWHQTNSRQELRVPRSRIRDELAALAMSNPTDALIMDEKDPTKIVGYDVTKLDGRDIKKLKIIPAKDGKGEAGVDIEFHPKEGPLKYLGNDAGMAADEGKPLPIMKITFGNLKNSNVQVNVGRNNG